ncbi:pyridoxamine 5'-phosphate oxidase family protein [Azohydromonas caseinilytica]|uniref:Pyridoxamine 5'-phosphate oxidase family protein n=1 Tax=Azohydromonas caseinilytica TaxID=2728836 RepID=A0A848FGV8_9BURK|nr:pyridoxamine 5'-phosphate oxidase family protein [Azohydromonas caseinilytica]NML17420.1 pyridoxamine 5'-phosphate oxidase family protein [Azohydromonas caseinilytica]
MPTTSARTRVRRLPELANHERSMLHAIVDESYVCHIAFSVEDGTHCIPTAHWRQGEYLYIHGSNGSRLIKALKSGVQVSVAITLLDGLVLAKSAFSHSMNYRSAVAYGHFQEIHGQDEKLEALDMFMEKIATGRKDEARRGNFKELAATSLMRMPLTETAVKVSDSEPADKEEDIDLPVWAGILPLMTRRGMPIRADHSPCGTVPEYVKSWAAE